MKKLVVVGSGRCGTATVSRLLSEAGWRSGHEEVYGLGRSAPWDHYDAEVSWRATPHLPISGVETWLLVRHPIRCAESLYGAGLLDAGSGAFQLAVARFPEIGQVATTADQAMTWWMCFNELASQHADRVLVLERDVAPLCQPCNARSPSSPRPEWTEASFESGLVSRAMELYEGLILR